MGKHVHIHLGRKQAADAEDGEGRWVTINGAAVFIKNGKITKGPPALKGKTHAEAHQAAGAEHLKAHDEAKKKGDNEQAEKHLKASAAHTNAGEHYKQGNQALGDSHAKDAEKHGAAAKTVHTSKPKPASHQKLHDEVAKGIAERGAKKHQDEHARLMKMYEESTADWQRSAANRKMEHNLVAANAEHAEKHAQQARELSAKAHASGKPEDHKAAHAALQTAREKVGKYGGAGYAKKQDELGHMAAGHASKVKEHEKALAAPEKMRQELEAKAPASVKAQLQPGERVLEKGEFGHYVVGKPGGGPFRKVKEDGSAAEASDDPKHPDNVKAGKDLGTSARQAMLREQGSPRYSAKPKGGAPEPKQSITQQAHSDAASTHRAKAKAYASPAHGQHEEGAAEVARMHEEAAAHHEHMAANPKEDHSARGAKLQDLKKRIGEAEGKINTGKGGEVGGKPAPDAKAPGKAPAGPAKGPGGQSSVQGATEAVKGLKDLVKKAGDASDPDPKKQD